MLINFAVNFAEDFENMRQLASPPYLQVSPTIYVLVLNTIHKTARIRIAKYY